MQNSEKRWTGLERAYVLGIFKRFEELYGNTWTSQMPTQAALESKMRAWAQALSGVEPKEIGEALKTLPDMPPSAPQFRALCKQNSPATAAHRRFPKALPKPTASKQKSLAAISVIKHNLRANPSPSSEGRFVKDPERVAADEAAFGHEADYEERKARNFMPEDKDA